MVVGLLSGCSVWSRMIVLKMCCGMWQPVATRCCLRGMRYVRGCVGLLGRRKRLARPVLVVVVIAAAAGCTSGHSSPTPAPCGRSSSSAADVPSGAQIVRYSSPDRPVVLVVGQRLAVRLGMVPRLRVSGSALRTVANRGGGKLGRCDTGPVVADFVAVRPGQTALRVWFHANCKPRACGAADSVWRRVVVVRASPR